MFGAGASLLSARFAAGWEAPFLITIGSADAFVAGALFAAGAEPSGLDEFAPALTLFG
jgi:hypothetical protein